MAQNKHLVIVDRLGEAQRYRSALCMAEKSCWKRSQPCIMHLTRWTNRLDFSLKGLYNSYMKAGIELAFNTGEQIISLLNKAGFVKCIRSASGGIGI